MWKIKTGGSFPPRPQKINIMAKEKKHKTPIGAVVKCSTGHFTVFGFQYKAKDSFYMCRYESGVNPEYNKDIVYVPEKDMDFFINLNK